jgi:hypothetical protein
MLSNIINVLELDWDGSWEDGNPKNTNSRNIPIIRNLLELFPDDMSFISVNLDQSTVTSVLSEDQVTALKIYQCEKIRIFRQLAYKEEADSLYMAHVADGDSIDTYLKKRLEIKARYPFPGDYR